MNRRIFVHVRESYYEYVLNKEACMCMSTSVHALFHNDLWLCLNMFQRKCVIIKKLLFYSNNYQILYVYRMAAISVICFITIFLAIF